MLVLRALTLTEEIRKIRTGPRNRTNTNMIFVRPRVSDQEISSLRVAEGTPKGTADGGVPATGPGWGVSVWIPWGALLVLPGLPHRCVALERGRIVGPAHPLPSQTAQAWISYFIKS